MISLFCIVCRTSTSMQSVGQVAISSTKVVVLHSVCVQTARRRHRRHIVVALASRATWPSIDLTATERTAPGTVQPCRKLASSWTNIHGHTITVSVTVVRVPPNRTVHHPTTDLYRRPRTTRPPAGRPLAGGLQLLSIVLGRRDTSPTATTTGIT